MVPAEQLDDAVSEYTQCLARKSPRTLRLAKESMNSTEHLPVDEAYRIEQGYTSRVMTLEDSQEARDAFLAGRHPRESRR